MNSKDKGKRGERMAAAKFREHGFDARRGVQYSGGPDSPDVVGPEGLHIEVKFTEKDEDVYLVTREGMSIHFMETDVRPTGRSSMGVRGIELDEGDEVVSMQLGVQGDYMLTISEKGYGKRSLLSDFRLQNRGGKGIKCYKVTEKTGKVVGAKFVIDESEVLLITTEGIMIRTSVSDISVLGRITSGVKVMNLEEGVKVAGFSKVKNDEREEEDETDVGDGSIGS